MHRELQVLLLNKAKSLLKEIGANLEESSEDQLRDALEAGTNVVIVDMPTDGMCCTIRGELGYSNHQVRFFCDGTENISIRERFEEAIVNWKTNRVMQILGGRDVYLGHEDEQKLRSAFRTRRSIDVTLPENGGYCTVNITKLPNGGHVRLLRGNVEDEHLRTQLKSFEID